MRLRLLSVLSLCVTAALSQPLPKSPPTMAARIVQTSPEETRANSLLVNALAEKNPDTRKEAAAALGLAGAREPYLTELGGALNDKDLYVRLAALQSTIDLRQKGAIPALNKALYDETPEVSFAAAKGLYSLGDDAGRASLLSVAGGESKASTGSVAAKKRDMLRLFQTPRSLMLFAFREGVGLVPVPGVGEGVSSLTLMLSDAGVSGRAASLLLLAHDNHPDVLPALREALKDKDASVRAAAVHSIALHDNPDFMTDLFTALDDPKEAVRFRAAAGYVRLVGIKAAPKRPVRPGVAPNTK
jgi:HEAT repeat protein